MSSGRATTKDTFLRKLLFTRHEDFADKEVWTRRAAPRPGSAHTSTDAASTHTKKGV